MTYALTVAIVLLSLAALPAIADLLSQLDEHVSGRHDRNGFKLYSAFVVLVAIGTSIGLCGWTLNEVLNGTTTVHISK